MRRAAAGVIAAALALAPGSATARQVEVCETLPYGVECRIVEVGQPGKPRPPQPGITTTTTPPPEDIVWWPVLTYREPVGFCIDFVRQVVPGGAVGLRGREAEERALELIAIYDVCPGVQRPVASPAAVARQVIEEFLPAPPVPEIDPGYAITGKPSYLETKGNLRPAAQTRATSLGDIEVTFAGRYVVDWGDGVEETFEFEGGPWPEGRIQHTYTHVGHYNVVVSIEWVADWRIGTTTGRINNGLASVARIDNFEVRQLQAVRDR